MRKTLDTTCVPTAPLFCQTEKKVIFLKYMWNISGRHPRQPGVGVGVLNSDFRPLRFQNKSVKVLHLETVLNYLFEFKVDLEAQLFCLDDSNVQDV